MRIFLRILRILRMVEDFFEDSEDFEDFFEDSEDFEDFFRENVKI